MKINFILGSLNDSHYLKRVQEFIDNGYEVKVYGFRRNNFDLTNLDFPVIELGNMESRNYFNRLPLLKKAIKKIAKENNEGLFFYSSLDIAMFARQYIKKPYIYEICDLTELVVPNSFIRKLLIRENKKCINNSLQTIITSEGFSEFYSSVNQDKFSLIPNKVAPTCPLPLNKENNFNKDEIHIGFVGVIRFSAIYNFIKVASKNKNILIHLFGIYSTGDESSKKIKELEKLSNNIIYHGAFKNPVDLPDVYKQLDMVLCTYPPTPGVIYAEPNKLYEAIYFRCPIIVSKNTFLGRKVEKLNIGYAIDAMNDFSIEKFIESINLEDYNKKLQACYSIQQKDCLNINDEFFKKLKSLC